VPYDLALVGMSWYAQALVLGDLPANAGGIRTLGFDGASELPWSEQGFTFDADEYYYDDVGVGGGRLSVSSNGGLFPYSEVYLTRDDGGTFDVVSLDVLNLYYSSSSSGGVLSNLSDDYYGHGLYNTGTVALSGPEFVGIGYLSLFVQGFGDGGGLEALLRTDNFVVDLGEPSGAGVLDPWFSSAVGGVVGSY
jgi:hypothetical protein